MQVDNEKYRMLYNAVGDQYEGNYAFCSVPLFAGASETQKDFEVLIKSTLAAAHDEYVTRTQNGEDGEDVMTELVASALSELRSTLQ